MSDKPESLAAILAEMRADADNGRCYRRYRIERLADRIEAAAEREREINQKILAAANDANAILKDDRDRAIQFANAAPHPGSVSWKEMHEVHTKARAILSAVPKEGNSAAMREALEKIRHEYGWGRIGCRTCVSSEADVERVSDLFEKQIDAALAAPARNVDRPECATRDGSYNTWYHETWKMSRDDFPDWSVWLFDKVKGGDHA